MRRRRAERWGAALLVASLHCGGGARPPSTSASAVPPSGVTRYRLRLRENPIDPGQAFRCYGSCQTQETPQAYLECLSDCPGFEQTPGVACEPNEVPPVAACFTARPVAAGSEPEPGSVVIAVVSGVALVVGLAAVCASQTEPCSYSGTGLVP